MRTVCRTDNIITYLKHCRPYVTTNETLQTIYIYDLEDYLTWHWEAAAADPATAAAADPATAPAADPATAAAADPATAPAADPATAAAAEPATAPAKRGRGAEPGEAEPGEAEPMDADAADPDAHAEPPAAGTALKAIRQLK